MMPPPDGQLQTSSRSPPRRPRPRRRLLIVLLLPASVLLLVSMFMMMYRFQQAFEYWSDDDDLKDPPSVAMMMDRHLHLQQQQQQQTTLSASSPDTTAPLSVNNSITFANHTEGRGTVSYVTTEFSGWNNQRQGAMMAWVVAYFTGHALQHQPFRVAYTGVKGDDDENRAFYNHDDFWDPIFLSKYVRVDKISNHQEKEQEYEFQFDLESKFPTPNHVRELANKYQSIIYSTGWSFMQHSFPWLNPWDNDDEDESSGNSRRRNKNIVFERLIESFTYSQKIQEIAEKVVAEIAGGHAFIALHSRKHRPPALDCQELGLETVMKHGKNKYGVGGCKGLENLDIALIERLFPDNKLPVYVASDGTLDSRAALPGAKRARDFIFLQKQRPAIISAVEQEIAIRAEYFVASAHSSWSEYVIYKRVYSKKDGKKNYDIWTRNLDIFVAAANSS